MSYFTPASPENQNNYYRYIISDTSDTSVNPSLQYQTFRR